MAYQTLGKLTEIFSIKKINERFQKRDIIIEVAENPDYPQYVTFQLSGDRCGLVDSFNTGDELKISFNLRGNKWSSPDGTTKYFNSLDIWKIEVPTKELGNHDKTFEDLNLGGEDEPPF